MCFLYLGCSKNVIKKFWLQLAFKPDIDAGFKLWFYQKIKSPNVRRKFNSQWKSKGQMSRSQ